MTKNQVCDLFHISRSTIERRMKDGTYKFTKVGRSVSFSRSDLGLPELPSSKPPAIPLPYQDEQPTSIHCEPKHIRPMSDIEKKQASDQAFAARYLTGSATDSMGNRF